MITIVGLDLSLAHTGWALHKTDLPDTWGTIESPKSEGEYSDISRLHSTVSRVADVCRGTSLVLVEGFAFGAVNKAHEIGALGFMVRTWLWKSNIPFLLIPPTTLKLWATGKGNSKKDLMLREVQRRWGVTIDDDNAADAYALLQLGKALVLGGDLPMFQVKVVESIEKKFGHRYDHLIPLVQ